MKPSGVALLGLVAACSGGDRPRHPEPHDSDGTTGGATPVGAPGGTPTTEPTTTWELTFTGPPERPDPDGADQHHASVAWAGAWWVGYQHAETNRLRRASTGTWSLIHDSDPLPFSHPQIEGGGMLLAVSHLAVGGLVGIAWAPDGSPLAGPVWFDLDVGLYADVAMDGTRGVVAWSRLDRLACARFDGALSNPTPTGCPELLDPAHAVGTVSVDLGPAGGWLAWSEAAVGTPATVVLAPFDQDLAGVGTALVTGIDPSWDLRPDVAVTTSGGLVVWRGADGPVLPSQAWIHAFVAPTDPVVARPLGGLGSDRPVVAVAEPIAVVAWEEGGAIAIEVVDPADAAQLAAPVTASLPELGPAGRPAISLVPQGGGYAGLVAWESEPVGTGPLEVWVRPFEVTPTVTP